MSSEPDSGPSDSVPLTPVDRALAEYFRFKDQGIAPSPGEFIARHLECARELEEYFANENEILQELDPISDPRLSRGAEPERLPHPRPFGKYMLTEELGRSGMGIVYRAHAQDLERDVALKVMLSGEWASPSEVARFQREARAAAAVDHPGIVPIHEVGEAAGVHYFTMKLFEGGTLASRISKHRDPQQAARLIAEVARAVDFMHSRNVLHRDLKPSNILFDAGGKPCVADFGLAKRVEGDASLTVTGEAFGSVPYMPPEQARGDKEAISKQSDVYSLGAIFYELLTGRTPYEPPSRSQSDARHLSEILQKLLDDSVEPPRPSSIAANVPDDLERIAMKCLKRSPEHRFATAGDLADELERWLAGLPIITPADSFAARARQWIRRHRTAAVVTALGLVFAVIVLGVTVELDRRTRREADVAAFMKYAQDLRDAAQTLDKHQLGVVKENLERYQPAPAIEATAGFEWRYLNRKLHPRVRFAIDLSDAEINHWSVIPELGKLLFCSAAKSQIHLFETTTGQRQGTLQLDFTLRGFACSPSGLAVALRGDELHAFRVDTGEPAGRFGEAGTKRSALGFSADSKWFACLAEELMAIEVYDVSSRRLARTVKWPDWRDSSEHWLSPDFRFLATLDAKKILRIRDLQAFEVPQELREGEFQTFRFAFSPKGRLLAMAGSGGIVQLWELPAGGDKWQPRSTLTTGLELADLLSFAYGGNLLATGCEQAGIVQLWDVEQEKLLHTIRSSAPGSLVFSPDDRLLFLRSSASADDGFVLHAFDLEDRDTPEASAKVPDIAWEAAFRPDGKSLVTYNEPLTLCTWDLDSGRRRGKLAQTPEQTPEQTADPSWLEGWTPGYKWSQQALSADGGRLAVSLEEARVVVYRLEGDPPKPLLEQALEGDGGHVLRVALSADGRALARATSKRTGSGGTERWVTVWAREGGTGTVWRDRIRFTVIREQLNMELHNMEFSRNGQHLALVGNRSISLWDLERGTQIAAAAIDGVAHDVAFHPGGRYLATSGSQHQIDLWSTEPRQPGKLQRLAALRGHEGAVRDLCFFADGRRLASASDDGTVRIWGLLEAGDGKVHGAGLLVLKGFEGEVKGLAISPDQSILAAVGGKLHGHGEVRVYYAGGR